MDANVILHQSFIYLLVDLLRDWLPHSDLKPLAEYHWARTRDLLGDLRAEQARAAPAARPSLSYARARAPRRSRRRRTSLSYARARRPQPPSTPRRRG